MKAFVASFNRHAKSIEDVAPLLFRLLLAYVFYGAAMQKVGGIENVAFWFESLGIPFATLNAYLATGTEFLGFILLFLGLGTRFISVALVFVLLVAMFTVHIDNGWLVIGSSAADAEVAKRLEMATEILKEYGNYEWLTERGSFVVLQNGIENIITYIAMLLALIATGPGRLSMDALIERKNKN